MSRLALALALTASGFAAGLVMTGRLRTAEETAAQPPTGVPSGARVTAAVQPSVVPSFTRVAGQAVKGVANISSVQITRTNSPFSSDPFFRYFFGDDQDIFGPRDRRSQSLGSGVIVSSDGYVVTNNHVVGENIRQVPEITVVLPDKREVRGKLIGTDPMTDVALLKINLTGLPVVPWGDSAQLKVGEWVLAVGSPFQLSQTVTLGIVSAVGRANIGFADYEDFIQTDAAINPGNSGGALVNERGELVGINTGILSESGGYQGIGFAIPSNLARRVIQDLITYGEVRRGSIGYIVITPITTQSAEELGLSGTAGALVARMSRDSEAFRAGIRPGDVFRSFNGQTIDDASHLFRLLADAPIGSTATIGVIRDGRRSEVRVPIVQAERRRR